MPGHSDGTRLALDLKRFRGNGQGAAADQEYSLHEVRARRLEWDQVVKSTHLTNCWYQRACNFNVYVCDGVVLHEEQAANYPAPNDPEVPDANPRGCQKGVCYVHRMYDPTRVKYPMKRIGERGEGKWQRLSWDQALTEIADKLIDVLTTDGPDVIVTGSGTRVHTFSSEGVGTNVFFEALGIPMPLPNVEIGDDHQGAALTFGKIVFANSADNWYHADVILVWGGNPAYTNIANYHYIAEARYKGSRVIAICPDYSPSTIHADLWVPVNIGTDAALALSMAQVIINERLLNGDFVREQTDLPLLVRADNSKLLREADLKRGGRDDAFYLYDTAAGQIVEAPRKKLALGELVPALEGEYEVQTLTGRVVVRPVIEVLRRRLDSDYTPEKASAITGVPAGQIEALAREIAAAGGVVNITTSNFCKFYHGDLIERAIILVFALCGHMGRKGATYNAFPWLTPDTAVGTWERQGHQMLQTAAGTDPRYAAWKEDGYTTEMIFNEFAKEALVNGALAPTALVHYFHGGLLAQSERYQSWDPDLKRPLREYVDEALAKGWQRVFPPPDKAPRVLIQWGGNVLRRARGTNRILETLLPKLRMILTIDWRMNATAAYSDYVLPACGWYERTATGLSCANESPFIQVNDKAIDPLYESVSDWKIAVRLARKLVERANARGVVTYRDALGRERRLDRLAELVTAGGLYDEDDEEGVARDTYLNSTNREPIGWEEFKERGISAFTSLGTGLKALGNACDLELGEPMVPLTWHIVDKAPYPTQTRRIQFYIDHDWYLEFGEELPTHKDNPKAGGDYPLQVTGGHARWSIHSDWIDDAVILSLQRGEGAMFVSAPDAAARGILDGDIVEVYNDVGRFHTRAMVSPAVRPGQVMIYHAWENYQFPEWHHFKTVLPAPMNPIELAGGHGHLRADALTMTPGPNDRGSRVELRKVNHRGLP